MTLHDLKIWPDYFDDVAAGRKRAELRKNDRNFQVGDLCNLREFDPVTGKYTGRGVTASITHVLRICDIDPTLKNVMGLNPCLAPISQLALLSLELVP